MIDLFFSFAWKVGGFVTAIFILILVLLYFYQNKILYIPNAPSRNPHENPEGFRHPGEGKLEYEDVSIRTRDGIKLHGWFVKMANPKAHPTIVYFHENAGNIGTRIPFMRYFQKYCNVNILLVAYRGFSYSEGTPTEQGLQQDAIAVIDHVFLRNDINTDKVFVFGRSLGGAVGIYGLSQTNHKVAGLILENTFTSISDMVDIVFAKLSRFKNLVLNNHWHSLNSISKLEVPMLFIMGLQDELIPNSQMQKLYHAAVNAKFREKHEVHSGSHNDTWAKDVNEYFAQINRFIGKALGKTEKSTLDSTAESTIQG